MAGPPANKRLCIVCDKESSVNQCARCRSARYCSQECQKADWPTHKLLCDAFSKFSTSTRPTPDHIRAVWFNPHAEKPELIWLNCERVDRSDNAKYDGNLAPIYKEVPITYNTRLQRNLPNTVNVAYNVSCLVDPSAPNKCVTSITMTQAGNHQEWKGPVLGYARDGPGPGPPRCKDLDMADFRNIVDYFLFTEAPKPEPGAKKSQPSTEKPQPTVEQVHGVCINCVGDVEMLKRPHYEAVSVPITDLIFAKGATSDIAERIGIPVLICHATPDPKLAHASSEECGGEDPRSNKDATFLRLCCDPSAESDYTQGKLGWGWSPMRRDLGSILVVRKDKKPLLPVQMEAIATYCREFVGHLLAHSMGTYAPEKPMEKEHVLSMICRPTFVVHWYKFIGGNKDYQAPIPYGEEF